MDSCRCGYEGTGQHPCHGKGYTCQKPAKQRFYDVQMPALAGMHMKVQVTETWACDACWTEYNPKTAAVAQG